MVLYYKGWYSCKERCGDDCASVGTENVEDRTWHNQE